MIPDSYSRSGFETLSFDELGEYRARGVHLLHRETGAEIYKVFTEDEENFFSYAFRTPPQDHTGVPHILEHAVLCGSERFPMKDPFLLLLKGSTYTFLNAITYPDKTVYPAASMVKADFMNLLRVYGDAVFFPNLKPEAFAQEGHRLEIDSSGRLVRAGIVLNEMKGSFSSLEAVAGDWSVQSLFPDTPYRWNSGGDPRFIPTLTYEMFLDFHRQFYHPSNVRIFLYGNHDLDEVLDVLENDFLSRFSRKEPRSQIPLQKRLKSPIRMEVPVDAGEESDGKSTVCVNWLLGEASNPAEALSSRALSFLLLGHPGTPLQRAIVESGLGEDLSPVSGLLGDIRELVFTAGIRGIEREKRQDFEHLVTQTLEDISGKGIEKSLLEGTLRTVEFRYREIGSGSFGLRLMRRALSGWLYGGKPSEALSFDKNMAELRRLAVPGYFEERIRCDLLENQHRSIVTVVPDAELANQRNQEESELLERKRRELDEAGLQAVKDSLSRLEDFQNRPDKPEDLARIPRLSRRELPSNVLTLSLKEERRGNLQFFRHDVFSNGVAYLVMAFDLKNLNPSLYQWIPLFSRALTEVGLPGQNYDSLARELTMKTGGLGCFPEASVVHQEQGSGVSLRLFVRLKALANQWEEAVNLTLRILQAADFSNAARIQDLLLEYRNDFRSSVIPSGNTMAVLRAASKHSFAASYEELWDGAGQLLFLHEGVEDKEAPERASKALTQIRDQLFCRENLSIQITADSNVSPEVFETTLKTMDSLDDKISRAEREASHTLPLFRHSTVGESLVVPSAVSFSALSLPASVLGTAEYAYTGLLMHILRTGYLWENIRMKGGAYGAGVSASGLEGTVTFSTYRDPHISSSLEVFKKSLEQAASGIEKDVLEMAVVGVVGKEIRPLNPSSRAFASLRRKLYGITDELRQFNRDCHLKAAVHHVEQAAAALLNRWEERSISVIAGEDALDAACKTYAELSESRTVLPV